MQFIDAFELGASDVAVVPPYLKWLLYIGLIVTILLFWVTFFYCEIYRSGLVEPCGNVGGRYLGDVWCLARCLRGSEARAASTRCMLGVAAA